MDSVTPHLDLPIFLQQLHYAATYGLSLACRSVEGLRSKTIKLLEYGYWDYFSELHDEPAGRTFIDSTDRRELRNPTLRLPHLPSVAALRCHLRTVTDTTDRHGLRKPTLSQTFPFSFSSCTTLPPTDYHKHDGPSQAP